MSTIFYAVVADESNDSIAVHVQGIKGSPKTLIVCDEVRQANKFLIGLLEDYPEAKVVKVRIELV